MYLTNDSFAVFLSALAFLPLLCRAQQPSAAACDDGSVRVSASGANALDFGATDASNECIEVCVPQFALAFFSGVSTETTCQTQGFPTLVISGLEFQPPGSPAPLSVDIYSKLSGPAGAGASPEEDGDTTVLSPIWEDDHSFTPSIFTEGPCIDCEEYVALKASEKFERVWNKILFYEYDELPTDWLRSRTNPTVEDFLDNFPQAERMNMVFDRYSDERPPSFVRFFHEYGSLAQVAWVPTTSASNKFTGLFEQGSENGVIRISIGAPTDGAKWKILNLLSFAVKFFRDGMHSSNILGTEAAGIGRARDPALFNVFTRRFHTTSPIVPPIDALFSRGQSQTGTLSVANNAWWYKNGSAVQDPIAPLIVHFLPNEALLQYKEQYNEDFRLDLPDVPVNSKLFTAYTAVDELGDPTICMCHKTDQGDVPCFRPAELESKCNLVELGSMVSRSRFVSSDYGDNGLFFKHERVCEEDRMLCEYDQDIPYEESTYTPSFNRKAICVSKRRVDPFECPPRDTAKLMDTRQYCATENEKQKEKMCPFAKLLHWSISRHGTPYPIPPDDHFTYCTPVQDADQTTRNVVFPIVIREGCCDAMTNYLDTSKEPNKMNNEAALQKICYDTECREEFESAFPAVSLEDECSTVEEAKECIFKMNTGAGERTVGLGFVPTSCCEAAEIHTDIFGAKGNRDAALNSICQAGDSCIDGYSPYFGRIQFFAPSSSNGTLAEVCSTMDKDGEPSTFSATPPPDDSEPSTPSATPPPDDTEGSSNSEDPSGAGDGPGTVIGRLFATMFLPVLAGILLM